MVTNHNEAIAVKEQLELPIAMQEVADNNLSKLSGHDIANRMIDSRAMLCTAAFCDFRIANTKCSLLKYYNRKKQLEKRVILLIDNIKSEIVGLFKHDELEDEPIS